MSKRSKKAPGQCHREGISVIELFRIFPDDATAREWFEDIRWPEERYCPHCGDMNTNTVPNEKPMPYHCAGCRKYFSVRTGTVLQASHIPLQKWVIAIYLMSTNLKGVSSMKLHRDLGITQKSAWLLAQKIRQGFMDGTGEKLTGTVEVDETYIGGKEKNKHSNKKLRAGRGTVGKKAVIGAKQRNGRVIANPIEETNRAELHGFVNAKIEENSTVITDDHKGYLQMVGYDHYTVRHSVGEYVDGMAHTNGIESFWAMLKRGYHGTYHRMSEKHLHRYVTEFAGRHNVRKMDTMDQMVVIVDGMEGKRLRYQDLVAE